MHRVACSPAQHASSKSIAPRRLTRNIRSRHIGRPVFATNTAGTQVWTASYTPFSGVRTTTGTPINARFPGQWFQSESGLHQNWMRDYDPTTGRYLQADPLGLVAGMSVYGYANQSPMMFVDPNGENPVLFAIALGIAFNVATGYLADYWLGDGCYTLNEFTRDAAIGAALGPLGLYGQAGKYGAGLGGLADDALNAAANRLYANKTAGDAFRDHIADLMRQTGRTIRTAVPVTTPFGTRVMDIEVSLGNRVVGYIETKLGGSRYTPRQRTKDFWIDVVNGLKTVVVRGP